ncbi:cytochrome P450 monooxygenase-like protein [Paraphoma chrysanthemicola]|uniref:Cytochrome P450 monooxygenase-like protein n=1 Tax=Paraphoma chrysanthemicola TaxID=798071 RepID=A0A8K0VRW9_9PLEO|nr:cytochrome P450 monooxygenase-like protein [Paraphoma chrysanthemicola]
MIQLFFAVITIATLSRIIYMQKFHPLAKFSGPWYAASFSLVGAIVSIIKMEPQFFKYLVDTYGTDQPIRISPTLLLFPRPSALKDIYWDPQCNRKGGLYGSSALGPTHLFTTIDGREHKILRKALSNAPWTIGQLKNTWEPRFDNLINLFIAKMHEHATARRTICLADKVAEFAADIMSMVSFTEPFGSVKNQRDEKDILGNWRKGLRFFGLLGRFRFFRERIVKIPIIGLWFLPTVSDDSGMGFLMARAEQEVTARENQNEDKIVSGQPDFLQHCIDARMPNGSPLTHAQRTAHATLLIQAGADTTGTALGSILRFLLTHPPSMARVRDEIERADHAGRLSSPVQFEQTKTHLPFFVACIKEGLRLHPPAPNLLARVMPMHGKIIDGHFVPGGFEVTSHAYTVQRDRVMYGDDAGEFNPDRWLVSEKRTFELEAAQFTFGMGPRICLGKDIAMMEIYKLLPQVIRKFDIELEQAGEYVVEGGVGYNVGFLVKLTARA